MGNTIGGGVNTSSNRPRPTGYSARTSDARSEVRMSTVPPTATVALRPRVGR